MLLECGLVDLYKESVTRKCRYLYGAGGVEVLVGKAEKCG